MINLGEKFILESKKFPFDDDGGVGGLKSHPLLGETTSNSH
jgi:hypothetical protein